MSGEVADHPGFKQTTVENWLEPDPLMGALVNIDVRDGSVIPVEGTDWIHFVNELSISHAVPQEVQQAFRFATGAIGYAYFYYPMFTIISQQVLRVADFAIDKLFDARGMKKPHSFERRLAILADNGLLNEMEAEHWDGLRRLRNSATHPAWQQNWGLGMSLDLIRVVAEAISNLPWPIEPPCAEP